MREFASLDEYIKYLDKNIQTYQAKEEEFLTDEMEYLKKFAKEKIGHEQLDWPPLQPSTIEDKRKKGYLISADGNPLLRTGELHDSIEAVVEPHRGAIGSRLDIALWQEEGTTGAHPIPARSYLASTLFENTDQISASLKIFMAHLLGASRTMEIFHD